PAQLVPEAAVAPVLHFLGQRHLQVVAAAAAAAHAAQREAARMPRVDQLVVDGRGVGQQPQPAEGIHALVFGQHARRDAAAADAVEAVAAGDVVAFDALAAAVAGERDRRTGAVEVVDLHVGGAVVDHPALALAQFHQVAGELGLAVHHHRAAGQALEVDVVQLAVDADVEAVVRQPLAVHALAGPGLAQHLHRPPFQHPGADPPEYVLGPLPL